MKWELLLIDQLGNIVEAVRDSIFFSRTVDSVIPVVVSAVTWARPWRRSDTSNCLHVASGVYVIIYEAKDHWTLAS